MENDGDGKWWRVNMREIGGEMMRVLRESYCENEEMMRGWVGGCMSGDRV